jgi:hypothetical protein
MLSIVYKLAKSATKPLKNNSLAVWLAFLYSKNTVLKDALATSYFLNSKGAVQKAARQPVATKFVIE